MNKVNFYMLIMNIVNLLLSFSVTFKFYRKIIETMLIIELNKYWNYWEHHKQGMKEDKKWRNKLDLKV